MGDGVLVEFASAVNAVQCAVELQQKMAEANVGLQDERIIVLRIGINLGDIAVEGEDLFGDGVNIAARLERIAEPGSVCISGPVYDQVKGKLKFDYENLGPQPLKNISEPVQAYCVRDDPHRRTRGPESALLPLPSKPSVAVLPFDNLSGDTDQEYFSDGVTEDIITGLSRFRSLFVIARNSSFQYRGKAIDVKRVGRELGVQYVLEGSLRKSGNHVRITAQLIDAVRAVIYGLSDTTEASMTCSKYRTNFREPLFQRLSGKLRAPPFRRPSVSELRICWPTTISYRPLRRISALREWTMIMPVPCWNAQSSWIQNLHCRLRG